MEKPSSPSKNSCTIMQVLTHDLHVAGVVKRKAEEAALDLGLSEDERWDFSTDEEDNEQRAKSPTPLPKPVILIPKVDRTCWLTRDTKQRIESAYLRNGRYGGRCDLCQLTGRSRQIRTHIRQHFERYYCSCHYNSASKETVQQHRREMNSAGAHHSRYSVDAASYDDFCAATNWINPPPFPPCRPTQTGDADRENRAPVFQRLGHRRTCQAQDSSANRGQQACTMQERPPNPLANYRIPRLRRSRSALSNLDRIRVIQTYLGDRLTPEEEQRRMTRKAEYMEQDLEENLRQIRDLREAAEATQSSSQRRAVREEIDELEQIVSHQRQALKGLRGNRDNN